MNDKRLGKQYRDSVSGFVGTVTGVAQYLGIPANELRLTAETGVGDAKERWVNENRCSEHSDKPAGFAS